jgi:3-dehydroquinate synthase
MAERLATVEVPGSPAADAPYPVVLGTSDGDVGDALQKGLAGRTCAIVTDSTVGPLYAVRLARMLEGAGARLAEVIEVPAGEASKDLATYAGVAGKLARAGMGRDATLVALGGGVVGDLGGFVAATYMRGVRLVMVPTSLLAMVDSSVGGKVGVDLPEGKNLIGAFVRPQLVVGVLDWLETLPREELSHGLAEVVKMGLLAGGDYFAALAGVGDALDRDVGTLRALVLHSIRFKVEVVTEDEREAGRRAILNYGHTTAHGLEAATDYAIPHGQAVAAGMRVAAELSKTALGTDLGDEHERLLAAAGLDGPLPKVSAEKVLEAMRRDKKRSTDDTHHRFVLLEEPGTPRWNIPVSDGEVLRALEAVLG